MDPFAAFIGAHMIVVTLMIARRVFADATGI